MDITQYESTIGNLIDRKKRSLPLWLSVGLWPLWGWLLCL